MTDIHLIELPLNLRALHTWATQRKLTRRSGLDEGLALHHLLGETFGPAALQPFRLLTKHGGRSANLMAYSSQASEAHIATAKNVALPESSSILSLESLRSVPRPASAWSLGQQLGFDLRVRPVVRLSNAREIGGKSRPQGAEIDVFQHRAESDDKVPREIAYLDWLEQMLKGVASLKRQCCRLARFQRSRVTRKGHKIEGPDAVIHGTLEVTDPAAFHAKLASGIGRHRSYGYGMLLLRPPQRG